MKKPKIYDYFVLVYSPGHPRAFHTGYVPEQVLVAEKVLKRSLTMDEDVRHINGDTQDNRANNLEVTSTNAGFKVQNLGDSNYDKPRKATSKHFVPCKFQRECWKEVRAPIARKNKIYLPYLCSFQTEGDVYKCSWFWKYIDKYQAEHKDAAVERGSND
jgi:hypothetical protein